MPCSRHAVTLGFSRCSPTQELQGLGIANLMGAAFNCYTTTGSFSRSAIMDNVGACTQLAGIISGAGAAFHIHILPYTYRWFASWTMWAPARSWPAASAVV